MIKQPQLPPSRFKKGEIAKIKAMAKEGQSALEIKSVVHSWGIDATLNDIEHLCVEAMFDGRRDEIGDGKPPAAQPGIGGES